MYKLPLRKALMLGYIYIYNIAKSNHVFNALSIILSILTLRMLMMKNEKMI